MSKYCSKCGRLLAKGEKCNCQDSKRKEKAIKAKNKVLNYTTIYKEYMKNPVETIKTYTNKPNLLIAVIQIVVFALVFGLFILKIAKNLYVLYGVITKEYFTAIYNADISNVTLQTNIPYLNIFLLSLLFIVIVTFTTTISIYLVNSLLFNSKSSLKRVFCLFSINTVLPTIVLPICIIVAFISFKLPLIILMFTVILANLFLFTGIKNIAIKDENKYPLIYTIALIINFVVLYILFKII